MMTQSYLKSFTPWHFILMNMLGNIEKYGVHCYRTSAFNGSVDRHAAYSLVGLDALAEHVPKI